MPDIYDQEGLINMQVISYFTNTNLIKATYTASYIWTSRGGQGVHVERKKKVWVLYSS